MAFVNDAHSHSIHHLLFVKTWRKASDVNHVVSQKQTHMYTYDRVDGQLYDLLGAPVFAPLSTIEGEAQYVVSDFVRAQDIAREHQTPAQLPVNANPSEDRGHRRTVHYSAPNTPKGRRCTEAMPPKKTRRRQRPASS